MGIKRGIILIMLKRLNGALPNLVIGIIIYGFIIQFTGVWFVDDKLRYSVGLWYGVIIAIGTAINLAQVIYDSVSLGDSDYARRRIIFKSLLRYVMIVILFFILGIFNFGNLFTAFIGMLGLKISAYFQPIFNRLICKLTGRSDASSEEDIERRRECESSDTTCG